MSTEQKPIPASINMDARNFLRAINSSAQSKVVFFENVVRRLGTEAKRNFRLVALQPANLMFEDVDTNTYYLGDIKKDGPRFTVNNIKKVNVVEEKKADLFAKNCNDLVDAISESDFKSADRVFNKIELQRFRSRVIPESGWITTRDGEARKIKIDSDTVKEDRIPQIVKAFTSAISDSVEVSDGLVVSGTFNETGEQFTLPVDEFTRRRIVARRMKQVAESAFKSPTFQKLVGNIAGLVSGKKVAEAVEVAAKFLKEEQEFCLLTQNEMKSLVDSALAAQGEFNPFLIEDVSTLMYRTNAKVNRDNILECWTKTAQKAQNANLLTQAKGLSEAKNFANDYGVFLESLFNEDGDVNNNRAKAYLVSLKVVKSVLSHIEGQEQLVSDIDKMVVGLTSGEPSTDIIYQAEELIAGISDTIIDRVQTLENYNQMPGVEDQEPLEAPADEPEGEPVPLPELGGEDELGGDMGGEPGMDAAAAPAPAAGADLNQQLVGAAAESKKTDKKPLTESNFTPIEKMSAMELEEELLSWKTDGHIYLKEDGFEDCFNQLNRYIDRCGTLGASGKGLREAFEQMRDVVIEEGNDVSLDMPVDPYAGKVSIKEGAKIDSDYLSEDIGGLSGPAKMLTAGGDKSGMSELQTGKPVSDKSMKKVDGKDGGGADAAEDYDLKGSEGTGKFGRKYGQNETTMADEWQSKTKGIATKGLKKVSGQDGAGAEGAEDYTLEGSTKSGEFGRTYKQNETRMDDELQSKTNAISDKKPKSTSGTHGESVQDRIAAALTEEGHYDKQTGVKHKDGGGTMDEPKGEFGRSYKEGETTMGDELQDEKDKYFGDKKDGEVCESEEMTPERIAEDYAKQTGMDKSGLKDGYLKQPKGEFGRDYKEGETTMSDELQDETEAIDKKELAEPVKEGAEKCEGCDDKDCDCQKLSEDQRKGPRRHPWGRKKAALAPREVEESKKKAGKAINEDVMVYDKDAPLDEVIMAVINNMKSGDDMGMGDEMGAPPVPGMGDEVGGEMPPPGGEMGMPGEEGMGGMEEVPGAAPESELPMGGGEPPMGGDAEFEAGKEFDAENAEAGIPPEGAPGHDEMESPEEKAAEADAAGGESENPFAKGGDKPEKKGPPKSEKKDDKKGPPKKEKKDDDKKEESFDRTLGNKLSSVMEEKKCKCGKPGCKCCKDCGNAKCSC